MKKLMIIAAVIGMVNTANAQCDDVVEIIEDKIRKTAFMAQKYPIKTNQMTINCIMSSNGSFVLRLDVGQKASCIREESEIKILLDNDEVLDLNHNGEFTCNGDARVYFLGIWGNRKMYEKLKGHEVISIRVYHMRGFVETDLTEEQRQGLKQVINCLQRI